VVARPEKRVQMAEELSGKRSTAIRRCYSEETAGVFFSPSRTSNSSAAVKHVDGVVTSGKRRGGRLIAGARKRVRTHVLPDRPGASTSKR